MAAARKITTFQAYVKRFRQFPRQFGAKNIKGMLMIEPRSGVRHLYSGVPVHCFNRSSVSASPSRSCWQCSAEIAEESFRCVQCGSIQNVGENLNYFKVFGLKQSFAINTTKLSDKFKAMQGVLHPDRFSGKTKREEEFSSEWCSFLNVARDVLLQPLERGEYLLKLSGRHVGETGTEMDHEFLKEIMEVNEALEESGITLERLRQIDDKNRWRTQETLGRLASAFKEDRLNEAEALVAKLKGYANVERTIKSLKLELGVIR